MELLAPAGSKESFISAINAGADSIYVGTKKFNARINADNLNFYDLEVLINHAKERNVKVFIVFNTLIKHEEINDAVNTIAEIDRLNPDGIIVQDLGIARIISQYFPNLNLHASTQLAVHNSLGADTLVNMGFKRVVLARELTFAEIKAIANRPKIEIEIFAHGALCFCISGMCFFSSVIGGYSGNRGLCTQPCRRLWHATYSSVETCHGKSLQLQHNTTKGYLFSPKDFELAEQLDKLKNTDIKSLKIEGRMRSSEYVYKIVKAYRMLLDAKAGEFQEVLKEARLLLDNDFARKKSICLFSGRDETLFEPQKAQCMGKEIGKIIEISNNKIIIEASEEIFVGDRVRISNPAADNTTVFKITDFVKDGNNYKITQSAEGLFAGNPVFKASNHYWDEKKIKKELDEIYDNYSKNENKNRKTAEPLKNIYTSLIARLWEKKEDTREFIWLKINNPDWLPFFAETQHAASLRDEYIIFAINRSNFNNFKNAIENFEYPMGKIAVEFPPFIAKRELQEYKNIAEYFVSFGVKKFILNNISQINIVENKDFCSLQKIAGNYLYSWNGYSIRALKEQGFEYFFTSCEDEFLNIRRLANSGNDAKLLVPVFGYPIIVQSRMLPKETVYGTVVSDKQDICLKHLVDSGMNILITEKPLMIFNAIDKLRTAGIKNFVIDLSFTESNEKYLNEILQRFKDRKNFENSFKFNFKQGIK